MAYIVDNKVMPNFLGIGISRCGTTWLHEQLDQHPEIYMPKRRKEISYFDQFYERGETWYADFFPPKDISENYRAIGEITPRYIDDDTIFERAASYKGANKYILMVRHPIKRLVTAYHWTKRNRNYQGSIQDYLKDFPISLERCKFGEILERIYKFVERDQLLVILLEDVAVDPKKEIERLAAFLDVSLDGFSEETYTKVINENTLPRSHKIYALIQKLRKLFIRLNMDWAVNLAKKLKLKSLIMSKKTAKKTIPVDELSDVIAEIRIDIKKFEALTNRKIPAWQNLEYK